MLNKLLKYDLKNIFKIMAPIYIVAILISTLARGAYYLSDKITLFQISYAFMFAIYIVATFSLPFATWIIGCIRFYKNIVKDEGYLMNTLPVKKSSRKHFSISYLSWYWYIWNLCPNCRCYLDLRYFKRLWYRVLLINICFFLRRRNNATTSNIFIHFNRSNA